MIMSLAKFKLSSLNNFFIIILKQFYNYESLANPFDLINFNILYFLSFSSTIRMVEDYH